MKRLRKILTSPYFLSLIPFLIIILTKPLGFNKYSLKSEGVEFLQDNCYKRYEDLDNDGASEEIIAFSKENTTAVTISTEEGIVDQWNFRGSFDFWFKKCLYITGDRNNDGKKELYVFTLSEDTILLNCISDFHNSRLSIKNRIIAIAGKGNKAADPFIIQAEMDDLNGDAEKELIFGIGSGFSAYPRNVFAYYISKDSLIISPESSYFISAILQVDFNKDGKKEIIPYGYAPSNVSPKNAQYHDYSSFLMVLDQNLKFLFDPIEFKGRYSALSPCLYIKDNNLSLTWLFNQVSKKSNSIFYFVNTSGLITDSIPLNFFAISPKYINGWGKNGVIQILLNEGLAYLNNDFRVIKTFPAVEQSFINDVDVDLDGKLEILFSDFEKSKIYIYRDGFMHEASTFLDLSAGSEYSLSIKKSNRFLPLISIQIGQKEYLLSYSKNSTWPYLYLYYPGIYLSILALALIAKNIQESNSRKKFEIEKKITELQLALIRNQLDPHFTFNVINSIIYSVEYSENEQVGDQLRQFASLYRNMLLSAGSTRRSIADELDFCSNYLLLQKMRFKETLNYNIYVSEDIHRNYLIPKFLIQIHVENAIKHGFSSIKKEGNIINIELKKENGAILIEIIDNGIGRVKSAVVNKFSTGKGLETMDELYSIYSKYYNEKVSSQITDLYNQEGEPIGTKVSIRIKKQNEKN